VRDLTLDAAADFDVVADVEGLNTMMRRPLAKLLSVPCNAKATTKPAAPITASSGARFTSSADNASRKPIAMMTRPEDEMMKSRKRCDVTWSLLMTRRRIIRTILATRIDPTM